MSNPFSRGACFFTLVNRLERYYNPSARLGELGPSSEELIRFKANPSLAFPGRDVASVQKIATATDAQEPRYAITANFLGLVGTVSPLPTFYSEHVLQNDTPEEAQRKFLDFFHHRLLSLFYRAGLKYRFLFGFKDDCSDPISQCLLAIGGMAQDDSAKTTGLHPTVLLRYAGLLHHRPRSASVLQTVLADYLTGIPVDIQQFTVRWVELNRLQQTRLGLTNGSLGTGAILGTRVRSCMSSFRVVLGPVPYVQFVRFLPCAAAFSDLVRLVRLFLSDPLDFSVELRVYGCGIPALVASSHPPALMGSRLGWTSWLRTRPLTNDRVEDWRSVVFETTLGRRSE